MGYYSRFEISQPEKPVEDTEALFKSLTEISGGYTFDDEGNSEDNYKWYDYQKDMAQLSKLHPDTVFKVHREGEEAGDIEDTYYKNGKLVHTEALKVELPTPDFSKF